MSAPNLTPSERVLLDRLKASQFIIESLIYLQGNKLVIPEAQANQAVIDRFEGRAAAQPIRRSTPEELAADRAWDNATSERIDAASKKGGQL